MNVRWLMVLVAWGAVGATRAADEVEMPAAGPKWAVVKEVDAKEQRVEVILSVSKPVYETFEYQVEVGGKLETRTAQRVKYVSETQIHVLTLGETRVVTAGKEKLDVAAALKRLAQCLEQGQLLCLPRREKLLHALGKGRKFWVPQNDRAHLGRLYPRLAIASVVVGRKKGGAQGGKDLPIGIQRI